MICPKCSQVMPEGSKFCQSCGSPMPDVAEIAEEATAKAEDVAKEASAVADDVERDEDEQDEEINNLSAEEQAAEGVLGAAKTYAEATPESMVNTAAGTYGAAAGAGATAVKAGLSKPVIFGLIGGGIFLVAAAVTLVIVAVIAAGKKTTINLNEYTQVEFEGVDGYGTAELTVNEDKLIEDVAEAMGMDVDELEEIGIPEAGRLADLISNTKDFVKLYDAISSIDINIDEKEGLSNGDTVTITYSFDEEKAAEAKIEFIGETETKKVSGLEEVKEVDPFAELTVSFEGESPNAYVSLQNESSEDAMKAIYFTADKTNGLKLGDTITVTVEGYDEDWFASEYGVRLTQTEKQYTVEGVDAYITSADELTDEGLDIMKNSVQDYITEYFADSSRKSAIKASDVKYFGYYFLANKSDDVWSGYNKVYMVYSATVSSKEKPKQFKAKTVYFPIEFTELKKLSDGSFDISTSYKYLLGSTSLQYGYWNTVSGYTKLSDMKDELVNANAGNYEATGFDGLAD